MLLITLRNVSKSLSGRRVLDINEITVRHGECVVLHGENGSGKSTLLKVLAGLISPDSAIVTINGRNMTWRQAYRQFRKNVVYLHQNPYLFDRTVADNVAYGLKMRGRDRAVIQSQVSAALDWAGLSELAQRNARELSGGEKQRVALTRARILTPSLLLLDEPTAAMDRSSRDQTFDLIHDLVNDGISVYIASHERVESYQPDRVIEMERGRLCQEQ